MSQTRLGGTYIDATIFYSLTDIRRIISPDLG